MTRGKKVSAMLLIQFGWIVVLVCILSLLLTLNISVPGRKIEGCLTSCSKSLDSDPSTLTVLSFNMLHGFPDFRDLPGRVDRIVDCIHDFNPDMILLQEVPWTSRTGNVARVISEKLGMNYLFYRANGNRQAIYFEEGEAILSRYPLYNATSVVLDPQVGLFEHRVALHAVVQTPQGKLDVFVTHLTNKRTEDNLRQAVSLMDFVANSAQGIKIVAGDFNAAEQSIQIQRLGEAWMDAYRTANPEDPGFTCCYDHPALADPGQLNKRIDYVFLTGKDLDGISIERMDVVMPKVTSQGSGYWFSDHAGLLLEIKVLDR